MRMRVLAALAVSAAAWLVAGPAFSVGPLAQAASPQPEPVRIMFIGDSITGFPGCWRVPVWQSLTDAGHDVDMVGFRENPGECGDARNAAGEEWDSASVAGSGFTTMAVWIKLARDKVLETEDPDVAVVLLGTNDLIGGEPAEDIVDQYTQLVELMRSVNPRIAVVVGTPLPISESRCNCQAQVEAVQQALPAWAAQISTTSSPVTVADIAMGFDVDAWTDDGIHPNTAGAEEMGAVFTPVVTEAVNAALESPPAVTAEASPAPAESVAASSDAGGSSPAPTASSDITGQLTTQPSWIGLLGIALLVAAAIAVTLVLRRPRD